MVPQAGRKVLFWSSVYLTALVVYVLFDRLYVNWLTWQGPLQESGLSFWSLQLGFLPIVTGSALAVAAAATMLVWNYRHRWEPATEVTYLFWVGVAIMAYSGSQLVVGVAYAFAGFTSGGWPFEMWLQPAVPFFVGIAMVLAAAGKAMTGKKPSALSAPN